MDSGLVFDPFDLEIDITPNNIHKVLHQKEYAKAIVMAFRLNEKKLIQEVLENVPHKDSKLGYCFNMLSGQCYSCWRQDFLEFDYQQDSLKILKKGKDEILWYFVY